MSRRVLNKKTQGIMQGNALSPILCNIYLNKLDEYVKSEIISKYQKGKAPKINPEYIKQIKLKREKKKPSRTSKKENKEIKTPTYRKIRYKATD